MTAVARTTDEIIAGIMKGYVLRNDAWIFAESVERGGSLVTAHALLGSARKVMAIIEECNPIASGITEEADHVPIWDEETPVSSALACRFSPAIPAQS